MVVREVSRGAENLKLSDIIRILNPKLSDKRREILRHFVKVSKIKNMCIHPPRQFKAINTALSNHWTVWNSTVTIGQLDKAQAVHWTVEHSADQPSDSLTQHWLTIGLLDTALSDHWTVSKSTIWPSDIWTQHCPTIGQLDKAQSDHWTVGHSAHQPSDSWTHHWTTIGLLNTALSNHWTVWQSLVQHF